MCANSYFNGAAFPKKGDNYVVATAQRDRRRRASLQHQNFNFLFGLVWLLYTKQAQYNEGCAKLNYLLPEV
jgi:hypothetical protein